MLICFAVLSNPLTADATAVAGAGTAIVDTAIVIGSIVTALGVGPGSDVSVFNTLVKNIISHLNLAKTFQIVTWVVSTKLGTCTLTRDCYSFLYEYGYLGIYQIIIISPSSYVNFSTDDGIKTGASTYGGGVGERYVYYVAPEIPYSTFESLNLPFVQNTKKISTTISEFMRGEYEFSPQKTTIVSEGYSFSDPFPYRCAAHLLCCSGKSFDR